MAELTESLKARFDDRMGSPAEILELDLKCSSSLFDVNRNGIETVSKLGW